MGAPALPQTPLGYQQGQYAVDLEEVEQLRRHQRSCTGSLKGMKKNDALACLPSIILYLAGRERYCQFLSKLQGYYSAPGDPRMPPRNIAPYTQTLRILRPVYPNFRMII
ncbi:hypothetical protein BDW60DRAFT_185549 [Aspergillus nidulans var. acristatus]